MANKKRLMEVAGFILNEADQYELEVINRALKKRLESAGDIGMNLSHMAHGMASEINEQVNVSVDQIRDTVRGFVVDMIKQQVPDISPQHLEELLKSWVPEPGTQKGTESLRLPKEAYLDMVKNFLDYSQDQMTLAKQKELHQQLPDWHKRFWEEFPVNVRKLIYLYLEKKIGNEDFWAAVDSELEKLSSQKKKH